MDGREHEVKGSWRAAQFEGAPRFTGVYLASTAGMIAVYGALDRARRECVAIKAMRAGHMHLLAHEFTLLRRLSHPNVRRVYQLFESPEETAIIEEWIEGFDFIDHARGIDPERAWDETLENVNLDLDEPLPPEPGPTEGGPPPALDRLRGSFAQVVEVLQYLHEQGIMHRDVKPDNIRVTPEGRVMLVHCEVARLAPAPGEDTAGSSPLDDIVGTPLYIAPETLQGKTTFESDFYAVGVMLFEALTGKWPFDPHQGIAALLQSRLQEAPAAPSSVTLGVPPDLDRLCLSLLDRDPAKRPGAAEILRVLRPETG